MAALMPQGKQQYFTAGGIPLVGGKVYTYAAGTTTPLATYTTAAASTPNANPVILDSRGEASIFFSAANYKIVVKDSLDSTIWTQDNLPGDQAATILANLAASTGSSLVGHIASGTGAVATTVQAKLRESVSVKDFGAVGDGTTDDTTAATNAIATGKDVYVPFGYTFAITGNISGFVDGQRIYGGGCFKKKGATIQTMFLLPDESDGVWFDGIEFDGTSSLFAAGNGAPAILGYITKSLKVTHCYFHDVIDAGIKLRDGADLYAAGNRFIDIGENGIELHNHATDVRTGLAYTGTRPVIEGNHTIIGNHFERITRYENPAGPLVDACGILFVGATGYPQKNIRIHGNVLIDCLRFIWTENNSASSMAENVSITGNTMAGGVNGGTGDNIFCKAGVGIIAAKNVVIANNTFLNVANTNPTGTETACIIVSGSAGVSVGSNIEIFGNCCIDDSGLADRTEWGIYCLIGSDIRIHDNFISGSSNTAGIYLHPTNVTLAAVYANRGTDTEYSWQQLVPLVFVRTDIPAGGNAATYPYNLTFEEEIIIPSAGRIVGVAAKTSETLTAGNLTVKTYSNGVEQTNVQLVTADFGGGQQAIKKVATSSGNQVSAGQRLKVVLTTDAGFLPITMDIIVTVFVDCGMKL